MATITTTVSQSPEKKKKIDGYGFFYDSEDEAQAIANKPAPKPLPSQRAVQAADTATPAVTTTALATVPIAISHGKGIKKLIIEQKKKDYSQGISNEDLFGVQEQKMTTTTKQSYPPSASSKSARSPRTSPYGQPAPREKQLRWKNNSSIQNGTPVAVSKSTYTMRGALETPLRSALKKAAPRTPQQSQAQKKTVPAPTTPAATPAPTARLRSIWHAAAKFLASPIRKPAELVRELDTEITPTSESEDGGSSVVWENAEEEPENRLPGSYRKTPEPQIPALEYVNPFLVATDPYAKATPRQASFGERFISLQQKRAMKYTVSYDGKKRYWSSARCHLHLPETSEAITVPNGTKKSRLRYNLTGKTEKQKQEILEEVEKEIEANRRERRIARRHDLEKRRVILAQMGVDWAEVEEQEKAEKSETTEEEGEIEVLRPKKLDKGKGKEMERSKSPELQSESSVVTPSEPTPPPSEPSSFLFGGTNYSSSDVTAALVDAAPDAPISAPTAPVSVPVVPAAPVSPPRARSPPLAPSPTKVTKKQASPKRSPPRSLAPPATPTLSHATLPPQLPAWNASPQKQQQSIMASPQKPASGLDPAHKARTQAEKFKPHVSSGLRASTTVQADSPPKSRPGDFTESLNPLQPAPPSKKHAPLYPLKMKKLSPDGRPIVEVEINQGYYETFLKVIEGGKTGDEKVNAAVNASWSQPSEEETRILYQFFANAIQEALQPK